MEVSVSGRWEGIRIAHNCSFKFVPRNLAVFALHNETESVVFLRFVLSAYTCTQSSGASLLKEAR
jgi:hypothetical protein